MSHSAYRCTAVLLLATLTFVGGCQKQQPDAKPPEPTTQIGADIAKTRDLPIIESATGAETALGVALDYDPAKVAGNTLYVRLTFPEQVVTRLRPGQAVRLTSFGDDTHAVQGTIREIRPALSATTLSSEVIVAVRASNAWRPSGSIRGEVVLDVHKNAVVVPEQAVVLRAAGSVVYVIENGVAHERRVHTGIARDGVIEILDGLPSSATVAVDGAALLADGAKVSVRDNAPPDGSKRP